MSDVDESVGEVSQSSKTAGVRGSPSAQPEGTATAISSDLKVLYSDEDIVVLDKPPGLRTVPGSIKSTEGSKSINRAQTEWHSGNKRSRQDFWIDVVHKACNSMLEDEQIAGNTELQGHLQRLTRENNVPRKRSKFANYAAVTLGLHGEEGEAISSRIWNAVDSRLKVEAGPGTDCLLTRVKLRWPEARHVHRLDQGTSGVMVMALTPEAAKELSRQFRERVTSKTYIAVLEGRMAKSPKSGTVVAKIRPDLNDRPRQIVDEKNGNAAETRWELLSREADRSVVNFTPVTGRTHQIRMHALSLGHPIMGDSLYGTEEGKAKSERLLLHATRLGFVHPRNGEEMEVKSPPPF